MSSFPEAPAELPVLTYSCSCSENSFHQIGMQQHHIEHVSLCTVFIGIHWIQRPVVYIRSRVLCCVIRLHVPQHVCLPDCNPAFEMGRPYTCMCTRCPGIEQLSRFEPTFYALHVVCVLIKLCFGHTACSCCQQWKRSMRSSLSWATCCAGGVSGGGDADRQSGGGCGADPGGQRGGPAHQEGAALPRPPQGQNLFLHRLFTKISGNSGVTLYTLLS